MKKKHLQGIDGHARPVLNPDGTVGGSRGALLVGGGDADGDHQAAGQNAVVPWVHRDNDGGCRAHGLTWEDCGRRQKVWGEP